MINTWRDVWVAFLWRKINKATRIPVIAAAMSMEFLVWLIGAIPGKHDGLMQYARQDSLINYPHSSG